MMDGLYCWDGHQQQQRQCLPQLIYLAQYPSLLISLAILSLVHQAPGEY